MSVKEGDLVSQHWICSHPSGPSLTTLNLVHPADLSIDKQCLCGDAATQVISWKQKIFSCLTSCTAWEVLPPGLDSVILTIDPGLINPPRSSIGAWAITWKSKVRRTWIIVEIHWAVSQVQLKKWTITPLLPKKVKVIRSERNQFIQVWSAL